MELVLRHPHSWNLTPEAALQVQEQLRDLVQVRPLADEAIHTVCGIDAAYLRDRVLASAVVVDYRSMQVVEQSQAEMAASFPYIPGLLAFREAPALLLALGKLSKLPTLILADGHGIAHPRRFGLACHLGVFMQVPVMGVAKSILVGEMEALGPEVGSTANIVERGEVVGMALRTLQNSRPVYLSVGNEIDLASCLRIVRRCCRGHRLPEPCLLAHRITSSAVRGVAQT